MRFRILSSDFEAVGDCLRVRCFQLYLLYKRLQKGGGEEGIRSVNLHIHVTLFFISVRRTSRKNFGHASLTSVKERKKRLMNVDEPKEE